MKANALVLAAILAPSAAMADFSLANNGQSIECHITASQTWYVNSTRTTLQYIVEGATLGALEITSQQADGNNAISYTTEEGTLTLSDQGDTYQFAGEKRAESVHCK